MVLSRTKTHQNLGRWLILAASILVCNTANGQPPESEPPATTQVNAWIQALGDDDFETRERAEAQLLTLGSAAIAPLEARRNATDQELRFRVNRIIDVIRLEETQRAVDLFLAGGAPLPGWATFSRYVGDSELIRENFVKLFRDRKQTLIRHQQGEDPEGLMRDLLKEYTEIGIQQAAYNANLMTCLSLQIACTLPNMNSDDDLFELRRMLNVYLTQSAFVELAGEKNRLRQIHRDAAIAWIRFPDPNINNISQRLSISQTLQIPDGLEVAIELLNSDRGLQNTPLRAALELVSTYGNKTHLNVVEKHLKNSDVLYTPRFVEKTQNKPVVYTVQVRDLALSTAIYLAGQKYSDYGWDQTDQSFEGARLPIRFSGFKNDNDREAAFEKWSRFRDQHR